MIAASTTPRWALPFQRVTRVGDHVREIDGLRCIALMLVLLMHLSHYVTLGATVPFDRPARTTPLWQALENGGFGVYLFFAISGFILAMPFARHHLRGAPAVSLRTYFLRRLTRLEPPLLVNLALLSVLLVVVMHRPLGMVWQHFLASCVYLHSAFFPNQGFWINSVTWSLEVEAQFYLTMPILAWLFAIRRFWLRQAVFFALLVAFGLEPWDLPKTFLGAQLEYFLVGFILADWWITFGGFPDRRRIYDAAAVVAWGVLLAGLYWQWAIPGFNVLSPLLLLVTLALSFMGRGASLCLRHWLPVTLGGMCYTLYLYHLIVIATATRFTTRWITASSFEANYLLHAIVLVPLVVVVCGVLFALIERPCMKWRPTWGTRRSARPVLAGLRDSAQSL
jgi:peptidoglycan/LPS O-acetylase OafA/YrhL